jgi:hypothetical protein
MIAKGATGAVADWEEEPWWLALADCASAFMLDPEDRDKVKAFSVAAMKRVSTDRAIDLRQAGGVVIPYVTSGQGLERAHTTNALFGPEYLRARCDRVIIQYRAAFP